jgi:DNA polymerase-3 subunit delta
LDEVIKIVNDIKSRNIKPIYFFDGREPIILILSDYIEQNILTEEEKDSIKRYYTAEMFVEDIVSAAKRYPMMAERQVIIVKEAQDLIRTIDKLESYAENPMATTVLVVCYKYKTLDKRKKVTKFWLRTELFTKVRSCMKIKLVNG